MTICLFSKTFLALSNGKFYSMLPLIVHKPTIQPIQSDQFGVPSTGIAKNPEITKRLRILTNNALYITKEAVGGEVAQLAIVVHTELL